MQTAKYFSCLTVACLAVMAFHSSPTMACLCMPTHPQTSFCQADYVIRARIMDKQEASGTYKLKILKIYKNTKEGQNILRNNTLQTPLEADMCRVDLIPKKQYIIAGQGALLSSCNYIKLGSQMTKRELNNFNKKYQRGCGCRIRACYVEACGTPSKSKAVCLWDALNANPNDLKSCTRTDGTCTWH